LKDAIGATERPRVGVELARVGAQMRFRCLHCGVDLCDVLGLPCELQQLFC